MGEREKDSKLSEKFLSYVKEIENNYRFLTRFIEKYQPLYIQTTISDTLHCFIEGKNRKKLCIYE